MKILSRLPSLLAPIKKPGFNIKILRVFWENEFLKDIEIYQKETNSWVSGTLSYYLTTNNVTQEVWVTCYQHGIVLSDFRVYLFTLQLYFKRHVLGSAGQYVTLCTILNYGIQLDSEPTGRKQYIERNYEEHEIIMIEYNVYMVII